MKIDFPDGLKNTIAIKLGVTPALLEPTTSPEAINDLIVLHAEQPSGDNFILPEYWQIDNLIRQHGNDINHPEVVNLLLETALGFRDYIPGIHFVGDRYREPERFNEDYLSKLAPENTLKILYALLESDTSNGPNVAIPSLWDFISNPENGFTDEDRAPFVLLLLTGPYRHDRKINKTILEQKQIASIDPELIASIDVKNITASLVRQVNQAFAETRPDLTRSLVTKALQAGNFDPLTAAMWGDESSGKAIDCSEFEKIDRDLLIKAVHQLASKVADIYTQTVDGKKIEDDYDIGDVPMGGRFPPLFSAIKNLQRHYSLMSKICESLNETNSDINDGSLNCPELLESYRMRENLGLYLNEEANVAVKPKLIPGPASIQDPMVFNRRARRATYNIVNDTAPDWAPDYLRDLLLASERNIGSANYLLHSMQEIQGCDLVALLKDVGYLNSKNEHIYQRPLDSILVDLLQTNQT